jgi:hypothetical protein
MMISLGGRAGRAGDSIAKALARAEDRDAKFGQARIEGGTSK